MSYPDSPEGRSTERPDEGDEQAAPRVEQQSDEQEQPEREETPPEGRYL